MLHSLVRCHALPPPSQLCRVFFCTGTSASSSGATASPDTHFMVEYLVSTCGFSVDVASKVSKSLRRIQSTENADVVLGFLRSQGLVGANLRKVISWRPGMLGWDVETNLAPRFKVLRDMGLSESDIMDIAPRHPFVIGFNRESTLLPRFKAWESLFGSREILLKNLRRSKWFFSSNIENVVRPNMNFLRDECGIPEERISLVLKRSPGFFTQKPDSLRALVDRADGIGIPRESKMFLWILDVLHLVSREKFEAQVKIMNSFGLSYSDFIAAMKKYPRFLWLSTGALQRKMEFLVKDVGITPSDITKLPVFLTFSLEKRIEVFISSVVTPSPAFHLPSFGQDQFGTVCRNVTCIRIRRWKTLDNSQQ
ncbi:transcription termination factor MTERF8, chloroplastic-like [Zingiber officinale]|uniref:transcription termination factor MTERF8, chloroplastic-like n=1 Tax=Zingiber officinale TaxID=94328 RepID=UPI001C4BC1D7|nr:transcription termination factor MTERF8, chloroplastic-like [Zingiber officinale]